MPAMRMPGKAASVWPGMMRDLNNGRAKLPSRDPDTGVTLTAPNAGGDKAKFTVVNNGVRPNELRPSSPMDTRHLTTDKAEPAPLSLCPSGSGRQATTNMHAVSASGKTSEGEPDAMQRPQPLSYTGNHSTGESLRDWMAALSHATKEENEVVTTGQLEYLPLAQLQNDDTAFTSPLDRLAGGQAEAELLRSLDTLPSLDGDPSKDGASKEAVSNTIHEAVLALTAQPDRSALSHHEVNICSSLEMTEGTTSFMSAASSGSVSHAADETPNVGQVDGDTIVLVGAQQINDTEDTTQQQSLTALPNAAQKGRTPAQQNEQGRVQRKTCDVSPAHPSEEGTDDADPPQPQTRSVVEKTSQEERVHSHTHSTVMGPPATIQRLQHARSVSHPRRWAWSMPLTAKALGISSGRPPLHVIQKGDNLPMITTARKFGPSRGASVIPATKMTGQVAWGTWPGLKHTLNNGRTTLPSDAKRHSKYGHRVILTAPNISGDKPKIKTMGKRVPPDGGTSSVMGASHATRDRLESNSLHLCLSSPGKQPDTNPRPNSACGKTSEGEPEAVQLQQSFSYTDTGRRVGRPRNLTTKEAAARKAAAKEAAAKEAAAREAAARKAAAKEAAARKAAAKEAAAKEAAAKEAAAKEAAAKEAAAKEAAAKEAAARKAAAKEAAAKEAAAKEAAAQKAAAKEAAAKEAAAKEAAAKEAAAKEAAAKEAAAKEAAAKEAAAKEAAAREAISSAEKIKSQTVGASNEDSLPEGPATIESHQKASADRVNPGEKFQCTPTDEAGTHARFQNIDWETQKGMSKVPLGPPERARMAQTGCHQGKKPGVLPPIGPGRNAHPATKRPWAEGLGRAPREAVGNQKHRDTEIVKFIDFSKIELAQMKAEVHYLQKLQGNDHIVSYHHHEELKKESCLRIYMEHCANGDLKQLIAKEIDIPEADVWDAMHQITLGLYRCHYGVNFAPEHIETRPKSVLTTLHLDLKPANIFLGERRVLKIGDFGLSEQRPAGDGFPTIWKGTLSYVPPEMWKREPISTASDIWSLGCVMYELCQRVQLFPIAANTKRELRRLENAICRGRKIGLSKDRYSDELTTVMQNCVQVEVSKRWDTYALLVYLHERQKKSHEKAPPQPAQSIPEASPSAYLQNHAVAADRKVGRGALTAAPDREGGLRMLKAALGVPQRQRYVPYPVLPQNVPRTKTQGPAVASTFKVPRGPRRTACQAPNVPQRSPVPPVPSFEQPRNLGDVANAPKTAILDAAQPAQEIPISSQPDLGMHRDVEPPCVVENTEQRLPDPNRPPSVGEGDSNAPTATASSRSPIEVHSTNTPAAGTMASIAQREIGSAPHTRNGSLPVHAVQGLVPELSLYSNKVETRQRPQTEALALEKRSRDKVRLSHVDGEPADGMISGKRQVQGIGSNNDDTHQSPKHANNALQHEVHQGLLHDGTLELIPASMGSGKKRLESSRSFAKTMLPTNANKRARIKPRRLNRNTPRVTHLVHLELERPVTEPRIVSRVNYSYDDVLADVEDFLKDFPHGLIYNQRLQQLGTHNLRHHMEDTYRMRDECVLIFDKNRIFPHGAMQDKVMLNIKIKIAQKPKDDFNRQRQRAIAKKLQALRMGPKLTISERLEQGSVHVQRMMWPLQMYLGGVFDKGGSLHENSLERQLRDFGPINWQLRKARDSKAKKREARVRQTAKARHVKAVKDYDRKKNSLVKTDNAGKIVKREVKVPAEAGRRRLRSKRRKMLDYRPDQHRSTSESL
ncbi:kinase-like protein [Penicillium frequentans]|nr:kinase-like protein [Penicillium glabrum]